MASLEDKFAAACEIVKRLPSSGRKPASNKLRHNVQGLITVSSESKMQFYSLYKQATIGNVNVERPGFLHITERKKWDSWKDLEGISQEEAKQRYVFHLIDMINKVAREVDLEAWLEVADPVIKENLEVLRS